MTMIKTYRYLKNVKTEVVVMYNKNLAMRPYMIECNVEGETLIEGGRRLVVMDVDPEKELKKAAAAKKRKEKAAKKKADEEEAAAIAAAADNDNTE